MRKISSWLKATAAAALVLLTGTTASAISLENGTKYGFTATYEAVNAADAEDAGLLGGSFDFTLYNLDASGIRFTNFVSPQYNLNSCYLEGNQIQVWQRFGYDMQVTEGYALSDASGTYPFGMPSNGWKETYLYMTVADDGNLSMPDFTVVKFDSEAGTCSVVARYSGCQFTLISGGVVDDGGDNPGGGDEPEGPTEYSFDGTYTFNGNYLPYNNGVAGTPASDSFSLTIKNNEPVKMLGYNLIGSLSSGYNSHSINGETYTVTNGALELPGGGGAEMNLNGLLIGGPSTTSFSRAGYTLSKNDEGVWTLTNFTIWKVTTTNGEMSTMTGSTLVGAWSELTCSEVIIGSGSGDAACPFAGVYTGTVDIYDYSEDSFGVEKYDQPFSMEINAEGQLVSICGYTPVETITGTVDETETAATWSFPWTLNTKVTGADGTVYALNGNSAWDDETEGTITLYLENGNYRMGAFSIWNEDNSEILVAYGSASNLDFEQLIVATEPSPFAGSYTGEVDLIDYTDDSFGVEKYNQPFSMEINADNQLVSLCGYTPVGTITGTVDETETAATLSFPWTLNTKVTGTDGTVYALNGNGAWDDETEGTITLYLENGNYRMGAFSIWNEDNSDIVYYYYTASGLEFTPAVSDEPVQPGADTYVVYNDGQLNSDLRIEKWWNASVETQAANPDGEGFALQFKAADAGANASGGFLLENSQNTGILHNATLNFKWYANTSADYYIRLTAGGGAANEYNYKFTPAADQLNQWNSTSINVAEEWPELAQKWNDNVNLGNGYVFSFILENGTAESVIYFNDVYYNNVDENWEAPVVEYPAPETVLVPDYYETDVVSVYSNFYPAATGFNIGSWGQSTSVTEVEIDGQKVEWLRNFNYLGYEFVNANEGNCLDLTGYDYMRVDMWTDAENAKFGITPVAKGGSATEKVLTQNVVAGEWNTYEISLSEWADAGLDLSQVFQIKFDYGTGYDCYVTNVLFYKEHDPSEPAPFALPLNITMQGTRTDADGTVTENAQFQIVVSKGGTETGDGAVFEFGGYKVSDSLIQNYSWFQPFVNVNSSSKTISFYVQEGQTYLDFGVVDGAGHGITFSGNTRQMGDTNVVLSYDDGAWNLSDFAIYEMNSGVFTQVCKWTDVKAVTTGIESITIDPNAKVEYYNLQGQKVINPANGVFIRVQGNKATKVIK